MLELHIINTADKIIVTLTERVDIQDPYYLFEFIHVTTKDVVSVVYPSASDLSTAKRRYNEFQINTAALFANAPFGQWDYRVYQQDEESNTDPLLSGKLLENGKAILYPATGFEFSMYSEQTTYKAYEG